MTDCSKLKNPLARSGTNRKERVLPALDMNYILPDENDFAEWMVYARNLADYIKYYDIGDTTGTKATWQPFFDADTSAQLALIAVQNVNDYKNRIRSLFDVLKTQGTDAVTLKKTFGQLIGGVFSLAYRLDYFYKILPDAVPLKRAISNLVQLKLAPLLYRLLTYYNAAKYGDVNTSQKYSPALLLDSAQTDWVILAYKQETTDAILSHGFSGIWENMSDNADDNIIYDRPYGLVLDTEVWSVLNHVANHNLFTTIFAEFLSAYARVVNDAQKQLVKAITDQNTHEPHYALFLTFLHLFKHAQVQLNKYTQKHLDFYYREVLELSPKSAEPNSVHVVFELANFISEYMVKAGTALKAGKDSLGKDVIYKTDDDIVVNKSLVAQLRSFFRAVATDKISGQVRGGNIYASPAANSADGIGGKITTTEGDWHPFVNKIFTDGALTDIKMPLANIGFAFASHYLFLNEGSRTITITWHGTALNPMNGKTFTCYITTAKGWLQKDVTLSAGNNVTATAVISIAATDPAITAYSDKVHIDKDIHQHSFTGADTPIIKFFLKNIAPVDQYEALKDVVVSSVDINVAVGTLSDQYNSDGVKQLLITTDTGVADPSKPFLPFGQNPKIGSGMVIGNKEVFSKANTKFDLYIEWADLTGFDPTKVTLPTAQVKFLSGGVFGDKVNTIKPDNTTKALDKMDVNLFLDASSKIKSKNYFPIDALPIIPTTAAEPVFDYQDEYTVYDISKQDGFMKLQLNGDMKWDEYYTKLQKYLIKLAANKGADDTSNPVPDIPYLPKIQSISLSYVSQETISFTASETSHYYHLYPFGTDTINDTRKVSGTVKCMPQFVRKCKDAATGYMHNQAEFYIGLQDVVPAQKVDLLFKVLDGSTDPLQQKPKYHITWSYLGENAWTDFDTSDVDDATQQLITTGIIAFSIPEAATNANTLLPTGYYWLKAGIVGLPEEVCRLIDVKAQAVKATFYDQENATDFLSQPLAANTIAKLQEADPNIKKVEQPFSSFGGRYPETDKDFYTRVSERLRHKDRAITMRDIEQLVLEKFDDIHKVKCLNHTRPITGESTDKEEKCSDIPVYVDSTTVVSYNEQAPGHVTVITIPDLRNKNAINPLRPYTSTVRIKDIETFLLQRANCNVKWHIRNPEFEEIRVDTTVVLTDKAAGNDGYYTSQLISDIIKYLTPWAYDTNTDIKFGGKIARSSIINFIERLDYIDVILDLKMYQGTDNTPKDEILAESWGILVAAATAKQKVTIIKKTVKAVTSECK